MKLNLNSFKKRDISDQEKIYQECHRRLYFTALRILNNSFEAEEVMHDTLLKFFARDEKFATTKERDGWLTRVCINQAIDTLRKRASHEMTAIERDLKEPEVNEDDEYSYKGVTADMVKRALNNLAAGYRLILSLSLFEGYDYEEIAQITELKEVTVRTQFIRGKARLREEIEKLKYNY